MSAFLSYLIIRSSPKRYEKRYELWDLSDLRANSAALLVLISSSLLNVGPFSTAWSLFERLMLNLPTITEKERERSSG